LKKAALNATVSAASAKTRSARDHNHHFIYGH